MGRRVIVVDVQGLCYTFTVGLGTLSRWVQKQLESVDKVCESGPSFGDIKPTLTHHLVPAQHAVVLTIRNNDGVVSGKNATHTLLGQYFGFLSLLLDLRKTPIWLAWMSG